jgi:hypothetical protein
MLPPAAWLATPAGSDATGAACDRPEIVVKADAATATANRLRIILLFLDSDHVRLRYTETFAAVPQQQEKFR